MTTPKSIYRCNEGAGYILHDYMGAQDLSAGLGNNFAWGSGHDQNAYALDCLNCRSTQNSYAFSQSGNCSFAWWFYFTSNSQGAILKLEPGNSGIAGQSGYNGYWDSNYGDHRQISTPGLNEWHHVGLVITASGTYQWYLDGLSDGDGTCTADNSRSITYIGSWTGETDYRYPARINDVHVWDVAVSQADIIDAKNGAFLNPGQPAASRLRNISRNKYVRYH